MKINAVTWAFGVGGSVKGERPERVRHVTDRHTPLTGGGL